MSESFLLQVGTPCWCDVWTNLLSIYVRINRKSLAVKISRPSISENINPVIKATSARQIIMMITIEVLEGKNTLEEKKERTETDQSSP